MRISRKYGGRKGGATTRMPTARPAMTSAATPTSDESRRPEEQHEDEQRKDDQLLERAGHERGAERLGQPHDEAAQQRAYEVAHPTEHYHHERHDVEGLAHVGRDVKEWRHQRAGHRHAARADAESHRADAADV